MRTSGRPLAAACLALVSTAVACAVSIRPSPSTNETPVPASSLGSEPVALSVAHGQIAGRAFQSAELGSDPLLVVVLHGDLLEPDDSYHYGFARALAAEHSNVVVVGLIRPGYSDEQGYRSDGDALTATGDNYTPEAVAAVAEAIEKLKTRYGAIATVTVGHSGGAAIAALIVGRHPGVANAALLVACPCDVPAWRNYMRSVRQNRVWQQAHRGLSPLDHLDGVDPATIVELVVGEDDRVTLPEYSRTYAEKLVARGVDARVTVLPGLGHDILRRPPVLARASALIRGMHSNGGRVRTGVSHGDLGHGDRVSLDHSIGTEGPQAR